MREDNKLRLYGHLLASDSDEPIELEEVTLVADPYVEDLPDSLAKAEQAETADAVARADVVVFLTGHRDFRALPESALDGKRVVDACGFLSRDR